jgi:hypothetical protein
MTESDEIKELRYFNTPTEPIHITGLPLNEIPPDTPNYLTDRTYVDIGFYIFKILFFIARAPQHQTPFHLGPPPPINKAQKTAKLIHFWRITITQTHSSGQSDANLPKFV